MSGFEFPRSSRLLNAGDYRTVFNGAQLKVSDRHLLMLATPNQLSHSRVGLVIAKKNVRLAVQRNRVKRIIRESFRLQDAGFPNLDIVVLAPSKPITALPGVKVATCSNDSPTTHF